MFFSRFPFLFHSLSPLSVAFSLPCVMRRLLYLNLFHSLSPSCLLTHGTVRDVMLDLSYSPSVFLLVLYSLIMAMCLILRSLFYSLSIALFLEKRPTYCVSSAKTLPLCSQRSFTLNIKYRLLFSTECGRIM